MKITVSVHGKFHAFQLARQLARRGHLERILSSDPRVLVEEGLPLGKAWTFPASELVVRVPKRLGLLPHLGWERGKAWMHDQWASRVIGDAEVVVAFSGAGRRTLEAAQRQGALAVCERGSTHIAHQNDVLREEFERFGVREKPIPEGNIADELAEYQLADRIMVPSQYARRTFLQRGFAPEKVLQVPYGADVSRFRPGTKHDRVFRVVTVGLVSLQKGVVYLLEAMKKLQLPNAELVLAGRISPEMEPVLRRYDGVAKVLGPQSHEQVAELLRQSSVFAFPSLQEGLSLALREALASGLPVVATAASGIEDAGRPGVDCFVVESRDVDALAANIERLYRDPALRDQMAREAAAHAQTWTWDEYGDRIAETYRRELALPRK